MTLRSKLSRCSGPVNRTTPKRLSDRPCPRAGSLRLRALLADAWRDQGRTDDAVEAYQQLVRETAGTSSEAVMRQHLGKAQFAAGRYRDARLNFDRALEIRVAAGADQALVQSSRMAAERAAGAERNGR